MYLKEKKTLAIESKTHSLTALESYIHSFCKKYAMNKIDLNFIATCNNIEIKEYQGPGFSMTHPGKAGYKIIFVDSQLSHHQKQKKIAKFIVHCLIHSGDQRFLPVEVSKRMEEEAEAGAEILLKHI